ncbi:LPS O-antigen chain length determinant protein WzzB [Plesiomonas shigelloides]|uniref:O antigen chain length determinant protein n=2 Tax=Plesiomonas shigelloides TaxID=703 RepID=R8ASG8_PLESH|nr:Wzz/FepE/Etk N-terminal domain-containing protein [Plesiomonas shigelloides]AHF46348.1 Wzz [Plesiomonas shigelloides]EON89258.1 O antigen chain length determinant protein [Plesiomonas shigelloides 302-73]
MSKASEPQQTPYLIPQGVYPTYMPKAEDEIDLFEFLGTLWKKKWVILFVTLLTTGLAAVYAFTAKEQWTAKTYIQAPRIAELGSYLKFRQAYARILNQPLDTGALANGLFSDLILIAESPDTKFKFLENTEYSKKETQSLSSEQAKKIWLTEQANKGLVITPPKEKDNISYYTIQASADSAQEAYKLLQGYLKDVNNQAVTLSLDEFDQNVNTLLVNLNKEIIDIDFQIKSEKLDKIAHIQRDLTTAEQAGIIDYRSSKGGFDNAQSSYKFLLGEKLLSAELKATKDAPIIYPFRYYEVKRQIDELEGMLHDNIQAQAYRYQMVPAEPLVKDRPKKALIILFGSFLGGVIAICGIFICFLINNFKGR